MNNAMKRLALLIVASLMIFAYSYGQVSNEAEVVRMINQTAAKMKTMQCDFVQTKHIKLLNDKMTSKGKMYYQQSDKLRWEYVTPYQYTFILNGTQVLLKNNGRCDVIDVQQNKIFKEIARLMMNSVVGKSLSDNRDFKSTIAGNSTEWIATLTPVRKDLKQMFQTIYLHFDKKALMVSKVILIEKKGDKTIIELKNVRTNETINKNMFSIR